MQLGIDSKAEAPTIAKKTPRSQPRCIPVFIQKMLTIFCMCSASNLIHYFLGTAIIVILFRINLRCWIHLFLSTYKPKASIMPNIKSYCFWWSRAIVKDEVICV